MPFRKISLALLAAGCAHSPSPAVKVPDSPQAGAQARVQYTADYYFFIAR